MKRKLLRFSFFVIFIFVLPFFLTFPKKAYAATCSVDYVYDVIKSEGGDAVAPNTNSVVLTMRISTTGIANKASIFIKPPGKEPSTIVSNGSQVEFQIDSDGKINIAAVTALIYLPIGNGEYVYYLLRSDAGYKFKEAGDYTVILTEPGEDNPENKLCEAKFEIKQAPQDESNYCKIIFDPEKERFTYLGKIRFAVKFLIEDYSTKKDDDVYQHRVFIKNRYKQIINGDNSKYSSKDLIDGVELDRSLSDGNYVMEVRERAEDLMFGNEGKACAGEFTIGEDGGAGCAGGLAGDKQCQSLEEDLLCLPSPDDKGRLICRLPEKGEGYNPCKSDSEGNTPYKCQTAIGEISTSPGGFIKSVLVLILSLSGGIIILLIIMNGYKLMISQGDPEKVKEARESVVSAIAGLLLIIFSIAILQFITVEVLNLPGFGP